VTFDPKKGNSNSDLELKDNHINDNVRILKMTQKYELDKKDPDVEKQIKKFECNMVNKTLKIFYHYSDGKITAKDCEYDRDFVITNSKGSDDKQEESNFEQQQQKRIVQIEVACHEDIKAAEKTQEEEIKWRKEKED
jgi:hypothetical protein